MNDILRETLRLVFSSTRAMPAHFTSNGKRTQSFCIDFKPLTAKADLHMASQAWGSIDEFLSSDKCGDEDLSKSQFNIVLRCGEDLMVGAFILTKLGGEKLIREMKKEIIDNTIDSFSGEIENLKNILSGQQVSKYFNACIEYGQKQAEKK